MRVWPFNDRRQAFDQRARIVLATSRGWRAAGLTAAALMAVADVAEPVAWSVRGAQLGLLAGVMAAAAEGCRRVRRRVEA